MGAIVTFLETEDNVCAQQHLPYLLILGNDGRGLLYLIFCLLQLFPEDFLQLERVKTRSNQSHSKSDFLITSTGIYYLYSSQIGMISINTHLSLPDLEPVALMLKISFLKLHSITWKA